MKTSLLPALLLLTSSVFMWAAGTEKRPGEAVTLQAVEIQGAAKPGGTVTALVKFKLESGYHVHSNQPSQPEFIATELKVSPSGTVKAGKIVYPRGKREKVEGIEKPLSVYVEAFSISVPVILGEGTRMPLRVPAELTYQACRGAQCYRPEKLKVEIEIGPKN